MTSISKIIVGGFKSIRARTEIPIAPLTFLFGPNSAGKSAVLDAIEALRERLREPRKSLSHIDSGPPVYRSTSVHRAPKQFRSGDQGQIPVTLGVEIEDFPSEGPELGGDEPNRAAAAGRSIYWALDGSTVAVEISEAYFRDDAIRYSISKLTVDQRDVFVCFDPSAATESGIVTNDSIRFETNAGL